MLVWHDQPINNFNLFFTRQEPHSFFFNSVMWHFLPTDQLWKKEWNLFINILIVSPPPPLLQLQQLPFLKEDFSLKCERVSCFSTPNPSMHGRCLEILVTQTPYGYSHWKWFFCCDSGQHSFGSVASMFPRKQQQRPFYCQIFGDVKYVLPCSPNVAHFLFQRLKEAQCSCALLVTQPITAAALKVPKLINERIHLSYEYYYEGFGVQSRPKCHFYWPTSLIRLDWEGGTSIFNCPFIFSGALTWLEWEGWAASLDISTRQTCARRHSGDFWVFPSVSELFGHAMIPQSCAGAGEDGNLCEGT